MKIVQATITYPPAVGGLDRYVKETSEGLVKRGHQVVVATTDLEQPFSRRRLSIHPGYIDIAEVHRLHARRIPKLGFPFAFGMKSVIRSSRPEVIHAHSVLHSSAFFAWQVAREEGVPLVISSVFSPRSGIFWTYYLKLALRMMNDASCLIAISEFERSLLIKAGLGRGKIRILAPGVDLAPFRDRKESILPRFGLENGRVIVSLGRIAYGKRVDRLIHALPAVLGKHPDVRLLIVGPDYGDENRLKDLTRSLSLQNIVTFAGPLVQDDVAAVLQTASAFAMTTDFELFGITLIEAMAAGAPVIAPEVASVPNVVRDGETGLLYKHDDITELSEKLNLILSDDKLRQRLIESGRREVDSRFSFERNLDQLEEIYARARSA